ncbi:hypothetical protein [Tessaracoccus coleopterorum]|uniref:hypothetical protein n=1 Tax=Tessaracoccus coleopterorum TaxID=2714950 RepID=UPI0038CDA7D4
MGTQQRRPNNRPEGGGQRREGAGAPRPGQSDRMPRPGGTGGLPGMPRPNPAMMPKTANAAIGTRPRVPEPVAPAVGAAAQAAAVATVPVRAARPWAAVPPVVAAVAAVVVAHRVPSVAVAPAVSVDASRRSSAGKSSIRWRPRRSAACASARATARPSACVAARP